MEVVFVTEDQEDQVTLIAFVQDADKHQHTEMEKSHRVNVYMFTARLLFPNQSLKLVVRFSFSCHISPYRMPY